MRRLVFGLLSVMLVCGCGGPANEPETKPSTSKSAAQTAGEPDPMAISAFTCRRDSAGNWVAKGTLKNNSQKAKDYLVSVFVGELEGAARTLELAKVQPGEQVPFELTAIISSPQGPCHLQALVLP